MLPLRKERVIANISLAFLPSRESQLIAFTEDGLSLDVRMDAEKGTVWLTQAEMAELFGIERPVVLYHLRTIYRNEEISEEATCKKLYRFKTKAMCGSAQVQKEGTRTVVRHVPLYNLDAIISVGYRVNSKRDIAFRRRGNRTKARGAVFIAIF